MFAGLPKTPQVYKVVPMLFQCCHPLQHIGTELKILTFGQCICRVCWATLDWRLAVTVCVFLTITSNSRGSSNDVYQHVPNLAQLHN